MGATWVHTNALQEYTVEISPRKIPRGRVPNVLGMSLPDAIHILENEGLKVSFKGHGRVKSQSIKPGTPSTKNRVIEIELI